MNASLFDDGAKLANEALIFLRERKFPLSERRLLSTFGVEQMARMAEKYGRNTVVEFLRFGEANRIGIGENESVCGWSWFEDNYKENFRAPSKRKKAGAH